MRLWFFVIKTAVPKALTGNPYHMPRKQKSRYSEPDVVILDQLPELTIYETVCHELHSRGYRVLDLRLTRDIIPKGTHSVGLLTGRFGSDPLVSRMLKAGCKVVRIGRFPNPDSDKIIHSILPDREGAGVMAADHFADKQFENVAFVGNFPWGEDPPYLYNAFKDRAIERGCNCHLLQMRDIKLQVGDFLEKSQESLNYRSQQTLDWVEKLPKPIGIFTYNDRRAALLYTFVKQKGFEVPDEVAFLGSGNSVFCNSVPVPLSSLDVNLEEQGHAAVNLIVRLINGGSQSLDPLFVPPKGVVVRQSTNLLAISDPVVSRAIRFIWDHFTEQLSIDDVACASAVSRCMITRKFRNCLGRSVNSEIQRKRLELSRQLLRENQLTIVDIAADSGFQSATYFNTVFSKKFGMTPGSYRKKYINSE